MDVQHYRKVNVDPHSHLMTCGELQRLGANRIVDTTREKLGPGGILSITNTRDNRYERFVDNLKLGENYFWVNYENLLYFPEKDIWIVKAQEVNTLAGEILVVGMDYGEHIKEDRTFKYALHMAKYDGIERTITIIPHPFWRDGAIKEFDELMKEFPNEKLEELVDGFEVFDANGIFSVPYLIERNANFKADLYYDRKIRPRGLKIGAVKGSDNHSLRGVGKGYITVTMPVHPEGDEVIPILRNEIKEGGKLEGKMTDNWAGAFRHALAAFGWYGPGRAKRWIKEKIKAA
ncbi:hypothetical protein KY331_00555 [Candidatus Woesearchaeota archaeon]|nr:hypothetical protein [Candidatus Woesearchaeota archaeon]